jgi:CDP-diacylglycerol pyrophosphatase
MRIRAFSAGRAAVAAGILAAGLARASDPSALWHIVHDQCVPGQMDKGDPAPCALVDLDKGYVVLKDLVGQTQFLVLPTVLVSGIEDPAILAADAPNYMEDAWRSRSFVKARTTLDLTREDISLAINSVHGRTQNDFHIHVDCVRADVRDALARHADALTQAWAAFPEPLAGQPFLARRVTGADLAGVNPFRLLADGVPEAAGHMGDYTLVAVGASFADGPGFVLLAQRADEAAGLGATGEVLQDHACAR